MATPEILAGTGTELDLAVGELTRHAEVRMRQRRIRRDAVEAALDYGRMVHTRGAVVYGIGHKEVDRYQAEGIDLSEYDGVQVVCSLHNEVITVYRNRNFRRLRPGLGRPGRRVKRRAS